MSRLPTRNDVNARGEVNIYLKDRKRWRKVPAVDARELVLSRVGSLDGPDDPGLNEESQLTVYDPNSEYEGSDDKLETEDGDDDDE